MPGAYKRILRFVAWLTVVQDIISILKKVVWSDECRFHNNGVANGHNCHYWSQEKPHWLRKTRLQNTWLIKLWCGIFNCHSTGPKFYELDFFRYELPDYLEEILLNILQEF